MKLLKKTTLLLLFLCLQILDASDIITLPDKVGKPRTLLAHEGKFFITEDATVHTFSLPQLKYTGSFGREGEGPGEFSRIGGIYAKNNQLYISSVATVNLFSMQGEFIKRLRTNHLVLYFIPIKNKYVGFNIHRESGKKYGRISLLSDQLKENTLLYSYLGAVQKNNKVPYIFYEEKMAIVGDRVFIGTMEGKILCFNVEGKKVKTINPNISPEPITKEFAEGIMEYYKTSRLGKFVYQMHGKRLFMPTHCPHIFSMKSDNENVLIETYEKKEDYHKTIVLDRNGNIAGTKGVPLKLDHWPTVSYSSYTIHKNKCYQLKENYEAETWEIHITPLADWKSLK